MVDGPIGGERDSLSATPWCDITTRWRVDPNLAQRLAVVGFRFETETGRELFILSGFRTPEEQRELERQGRPTAPVDRSNHTICPARAADVWAPGLTDAMKATLGRIAIEAGLRWGGGSPVDPQTGIPSDWNHLDLGPRP